VKSARLAVLLAAFAFGCGADPPADAIYVRVQNDTELDFTVLLLAFGVELGPLGAGETSAYRETDALLYAFVGGYAEVGTQTFFGMVTDHVGDVPLENGYYTYGVSLAPPSRIGGNDGLVFFGLL
jgi:hypothetical protein